MRYKSKLKRNNKNHVVSIEREKNTGAVFDYSKYYRFSEIINKNQKFEAIYIKKYYFEKFFKETLYKLKNLNDQSYICKFNDISRYLYNINIMKKSILNRLY